MSSLRLFGRVVSIWSSFEVEENASNTKGMSSNSALRRPPHSGSKWLKSAKNNFTKCDFFQCKLQPIHIISVSGHFIHFLIYQTVLGIYMISWFHNFFLYHNCWRIFEIWSHCAPQRQLKLLKRKRETLIVSTATAFAFSLHFPCQSQFIQSLFGFAF